MKKKKIIFIIFIAIMALCIVVNAYNTKKKLISTYENGVAMFNKGHYQEAIDCLEPLGDYKKSIAYVKDAKELLEHQKEDELNELVYEKSEKLFSEGDYTKAIEGYETLGDYKDSKEKIEKAKKLDDQQNKQENDYNKAVNLYENKDFVSASSLFYSLEEYKDSEYYYSECLLQIKRRNLSKTISAGIRSSACVTQSGGVIFSGDDTFGKAKDKLKTWEDIVSISAYGENILGLKEDGRVEVASVTSNYKIDTSEWTDIIDISSGDMFVVALKNDGTLTAQGHNGDGQIEIDDWKDVIDVDCGWRHTAGLTSKGEVKICGKGAEAQLKQIEDKSEAWKDIVSISAGGGEKEGTGHTVGLKSDGTVVAVGANVYGQCNVEDWSDIVAVSAGDFHTVGLKKDGTVVSTDTNADSYKELSEWTDIVDISAGYGFTVGLKKDGTVLAAGFTHQGQGDVQSWKNVAKRNEWYQASLLDKF